MTGTQPPSADDWLAMKDLFGRALDVPPADRPAFLDAACPDPGLRAAVERLLDADAEAPSEAGPFLGDAGTFVPILDAVSGRAALSGDGRRIGPFQTRERIGEGGMGEVFLADRVDGGFAQTAALKLVKPGMDTRAVLRRFEAERAILARLDHPGIARLLEGGATADGQPWFAMEFVDGEPLTGYAASRGLTLDERLDLFEGVCAAVQHAHARLVVHRDIKPSNVLVVEDDPPSAAGPGRRSIKLLDFGIARLLGGDDPEATILTGPGIRPMTRAYAAPEQIRGEPTTTVTDVYALGVLLYELLTGRRPFEADSALALERAILHDEPARPSTVQREAERSSATHGATVTVGGPAAGGAAGLSGTTAISARLLQGDLDTICLTALRKEPEARYASVQSLREDVRRHLAGLPIVARTPTLAYRLRKFVGRNRLAVAAGVLLLAATAAGVGSTLWQARATRAAAADSEAAAAFLGSLLGAADPLQPERRDTLRVGDLLDEGAGRVRAELAGQPRVQARLLHVLGQTYRGVQRWDASEPLLREAVALYRQTGAAPAVLSEALADLALTRASQGDPAEAVPLAREALTLAGSDPEARVRAETVLGQVLLRAPDSAGADSLLRVALGRARAVHGEQSLTVALIEQNLGDAVLDAGRVDEALSLYTASLERTEAVTGPEHPLLVARYLSLAFAHLMAGDAEASEAAARRAVEIARAAGPASTRLGQALTAHAQALRRLGRLAEAEAELREAIPLIRRRPADQALPLGTLASVLEARGDLAGAVDAQRQSFRLVRTVDAQHQPVVAGSAAKLAGLLVATGAYAEAERVLKEAEGDLVAGGASAVARRQVAGAYVALYEAWGRPAQAARYRDESTPPRGHPHAARQ